MDVIDWDGIYPKLLAYTHSLLEAKSWFRKKGSGSYLGGKQVDDYVMTAIEKFLKHPEKFKESSGRSLENYLKRHIISSIVYNDSISTENKTSSTLHVQRSDKDEEEFGAYLNPLLPSIVADFDEEIDYRTIMMAVQDEVKDDEVVSVIFKSHCLEEMLRREIIDKYDISPKEYDKGMKRLNTILKRKAQEYDIIQAR